MAAIIAPGPGRALIANLLNMMRISSKIHSFFFKLLLLSSDHLCKSYFNCPKTQQINILNDTNNQKNSDSDWTVLIC